VERIEIVYQRERTLAIPLHKARHSTGRLECLNASEGLLGNEEAEAVVMSWHLCQPSRLSYWQDEEEKKEGQKKVEIQETS
jgi:hypothetical protein